MGVIHDEDVSEWVMIKVHTTINQPLGISYVCTQKHSMAVAMN